MRMIGGRLMAAIVLGAALLAPVLAHAQVDGPLVLLDLPTMGPQHSLGTWLEGELAAEELVVRRPDLDEEGPLADTPACVVTWSDPGRGGLEIKELRGHVRRGRGLVYIVGTGEQHVRRARSLWGRLDVNIEEADGDSGYASWVEHPLTEGAEAIGAVTPGATITGVGGNPLAQVNGRPIAIAFDWGPLGRAVIIDQSLLFDPLHQDSPRPAVGDVLVRAVRWAARVGETVAPPEPPEGRPGTPIWGDLPEPEPVGPPARMRALLDVPNDRDDWPHLRELLVRELERADLEIDEPRAGEGEPVITAERLERTGLLVVGSGREDVHYTEPLAVGRFFDGGGRVLFVGHAVAKSQKRMIGFNQLMTSLQIAASLNRHSGFAVFMEHPITAGLVPPPDDLRIRRGMQIWAPLTDTLVEIYDRPAAAAWQSGTGRAVILDGELLRVQEGQRQDRPLRVFIDLLRHSIEWLLGEL